MKKFATEWNHGDKVFGDVVYADTWEEAEEICVQRWTPEKQEKIIGEIMQTFLVSPN